MSPCPASQSGLACYGDISYNQNNDSSLVILNTFNYNLYKEEGRLAKVNRAIISKGPPFFRVRFYPKN